MYFTTIKNNDKKYTFNLKYLVYSLFLGLGGKCWQTVEGEVRNLYYNMKKALNLYSDCGGSNLMYTFDQTHQTIHLK